MTRFIDDPPGVPDPIVVPLAVIWDCDGVLIDSEPLHYEAVRAALVGSDATLSKEENEALLGASLPTVWRTLADRGLSVPFDVWAARVEAYYLNHLDDSLARPGAVEAVLRVARAGLPQACVSSAERQVHRANLKAIGLLDAFAVVISREDVACTKPAADPYLQACEGMGIRPGSCLAVEDTPVGVASARAAGVRVLAWPNASTRALDFDLDVPKIAELADAPFFARLARQDP